MKSILIKLECFYSNQKQHFENLFSSIRWK